MDAGEKHERSRVNEWGGPSQSMYCSIRGHIMITHPVRMYHYDVLDACIVSGTLVCNF